MTQTRAVFVFKLLLCIVYIVGNALFILTSLLDIFSGEPIDYWVLAYIPMHVLYLLGGLYLYANYTNLVPHYRLRIITIAIALFILDTLYLGAVAFASVMYPHTFNPPLVEASAEALTAGWAFGYGFSLLLLFAEIRLLNIASGAPKAKAPMWMTAIGWALILILVGIVLAAAVVE